MAQGSPDMHGHRPVTHQNEPTSRRRRIRMLILSVGSFHFDNIETPTHFRKDAGILNVHFKLLKGPGIYFGRFDIHILLSSFLNLKSPYLRRQRI